MLSEESQIIDWNDDELTWYGYEEGMRKIQDSGNPGLFIIYADWCSVCKGYAKMFKHKEVVKNLDGIVLIRVNREHNLKISNKYDFDGVYIPRTFALNNKGEVMRKFYSEEEEYAYFIPPDNFEYITMFSKLIKKYGK